MPGRRIQGGIYRSSKRYTDGMAKHLVDIDETVLSAAQAELGTATMKETVNEALKRASAGRNTKVREALDRLAKRDFSREDAWR
jgi:Arc/MetJ family transcription regulator